MAVTTGKVFYPKLAEPSKANGPFKSKYEVNLEITDEAERDKLKALGLAPHHKTGNFKFWSSGVDKNNNTRPRPRVVDAHKQELSVEDIENIGNGSLIKVQFQPMDYNFAGNKGVFGLLQQVQVLKLIPKVADEFGEEEGFASASDEF